MKLFFITIFIVTVLFTVFAENTRGSFYDIKGMNYTAWDDFILNSEQSDMSLSKMRNIGCNWTSICIWWFQDDVNSTLIEPDYSKYSVDPNSVEHAIDYCHTLGMKVMLKPIINCRDGTWNGHINPSTAWFSSYHNFINFWADLAENHNVELFCVGAELGKTESWSASWRSVIGDVKSHYSGPLTYAANYNDEATIDWWDALDYIGIDPYYPLTDVNNPTESQLQNAWQSKADSLEAWLYANWPDKQIIFAEIGYQSCDGTNRTPWRRNPSIYPIDLQEQVDCYKALLDQLQNRPWWSGVFWWNWETDPNAGGPQNAWHTPQNKPAEALLANYYVYCCGSARGDFNRDYKVDMVDINILTNNWLTNTPAIDVSPYPAGDGIINFLDYGVLLKNWSLIFEGDINRDSTVTLEDLKMLAEQWLWTGQCGGIAEDIYEDGTVNFKDFAKLAEQWLNE